jgi:uncharacterized membrane protein YgcG
MKKKLFISALLVLFLPAFLFAQRVVDNAGVLSASEKADLERQLAEIASAYSFDLVIVTEKDIGNAWAGDYADNFFDHGGYGLGEGRDGSLFLQVTANRDYWFSVSGRGVKILNNTALGKLEADVIKFLSGGDYAGAYHAFVETWGMFLALDAKGGRSYNFFYKWNALLVFIAWVLALLIGFLVVQSWESADEHGPSPKAGRSLCNSRKPCLYGTKGKFSLQLGYKNQEGDRKFFIGWFRLFGGKARRTRR